MLMNFLLDSLVSLVLHKLLFVVVTRRRDHLFAFSFRCTYVQGISGEKGQYYNFFCFEWFLIYILYCNLWFYFWASNLCILTPIESALIIIRKATTGWKIYYFNWRNRIFTAKKHSCSLLVTKYSLYRLHFSLICQRLVTFDFLEQVSILGYNHW